MNPEQEKETTNRDFPQYLCKMCGKCCRSITTELTYNKLKKMAKEGSDGAKAFIEIFKPYDNVWEAKKIVPEQVDQVLNELKQKNYDINKVKFYYCPHITEENKCGIYEKRPSCCKSAPEHGWSCMPPGCGFEGWQFEERERIKQEVRKLKEYIITAEAIAEEDGTIPGQKLTLSELKNLIEKKIAPLEKYGSRFW